MLGGVCECEVQVPQAIADGATTAGAIADGVGARPDAIERVLRFFASRGWFARKRDGSYRLNALRHSPPARRWMSSPSTARLPYVGAPAVS